MSQSRAGSILEVIVSTFVGLAVAFAAQGYLYVLYGVEVSPLLNLKMTAWMTLLSICRGYVLRRLFNGQVWRKLSKPMKFRVCRSMYYVETSPGGGMFYMHEKARKRLKNGKVSCCYNSQGVVEVTGTTDPVRFLWWSILGIIEPDVQR